MVDAGTCDMSHFQKLKGYGWERCLKITKAVVSCKFYFCYSSTWNAYPTDQFHHFGRFTIDFITFFGISQAKPVWKRALLLERLWVRAEDKKKRTRRKNIVLLRRAGLREAIVDGSTVANNIRNIGSKAVEEGRLFPSQKVTTRGSKQNFCFEMGEY